MSRRIPFTRELLDRGASKAVAQIANCSHAGCKKTQPIFNPKGSRVMPPAMFADKLRQHGWEVRGVDTYCPEHARHSSSARPASVALREVKAQPAPRPKVALSMTDPSPTQEAPVAHSPTPIRDLSQLGVETAERLMTSEQKRKINRLIFDHWDDTKTRYLGDMTDQRIATQIGLPRAWVEQVRVELFGDSGSNQEIEDFKAELDERIAGWEAVVREATQAVEKAMGIVGKLEASVTDLKALRKRLERVESAVLPRR